MKLRHKIYGLSLAAGILFTAFKASAETVSISTYYPSPYGAYKSLDTTDETHFATDGGKVGIGTKEPLSKLSVKGGDVEVLDDANGLILRSPNGKRWRLQVLDSGAAIFTSVP